MTLSLTYEIVPDPPPPMSWDAYERTVSHEWAELLESDAASDERRLQQFVETHPSLVPGAFGVGRVGNHGPFPHAVISQPRLPGLGTKVPDFMWITRDSATLRPILVEIEAPTKRWFTKGGIASADLTRALDQLLQWRVWFAQPENQALFLREYRVPEDFAARTLVPSYVLVYGRRSETDGRPELHRKRTQMAKTDETLMTFDRLGPAHSARWMMCVTLQETGYRAKTIPPTLVLGPGLASDFALIADKDHAVERCALLTPERRAFLRSRFRYWDDWAKKEKRGWIKSSDKE